MLTSYGDFIRSSYSVSSTLTDPTGLYSYVKDITYLSLIDLVRSSPCRGNERKEPTKLVSLGRRKSLIEGLTMLKVELG